MSVSKVQLTGGNFQDAEGNLLSGGYLSFRLNQDGNVNDSLICAGIAIQINLDGYGAIIAGQYVWGNDQLSPVNSYYRVTGYTSKGQIAWGPNNQQVTGNGGAFDVGTWIPNQVISWTPPVVIAAIELETNGTPNGSQSLLNLQQGANVTLTDDGLGQVTIAAAGAPPALPLPMNAAFAMWESDFNASNRWEATNDIVNGNDSGTTENDIPPSATAGRSMTTAKTYAGGSGTTRGFTGQQFIYPGRLTTFSGIADYAATGSGMTLAIGLGNQAVNVDPLSNACHFALITGGSGGNWHLQVSDSSATTSVDTGIAVTNSSREKFSIILSAGTATAYHNGTLVATASTHLPTAPLGICWYLINGGSGGVTTTITSEYMYADNVTP